MAPTNSASDHHIDMLKKYIDYHCWITKAKEKGRFFRIAATGNFSKLKKELKKRGFIEQIYLPSESVYFTMPNSILLEEAQRGNEYERALVAKIIGKRPPDFIWVARAPSYMMLGKISLLNKIYIKGSNFGVKNDMLKYIQRIRETDKREALLKYPRSYNMCDRGAQTAFQRDFRMTAAIGLVKFLHDQKKAIKEWFTAEREDGVETAKIYGLDLAIHLILMHVKHADGNLSNEDLARCCSFTEQQWQQMLDAHQHVVKHKRRIHASNEQRDDYVARIKMIAPDIPQYFKKQKHDGIHNIWMMKPCYSCQGAGIILSDNEKHILHWVNSHRGRYVVQKYIERPFLIYNCKFDLRQYYLVTMDNEYVRFWSHWLCTCKLASEEFSFDDFNEQKHITNTTVQRRYKRENTENLPYHHMWSIHTLIDHFEKMGRPDVYDKKIYPTIKHVLRMISKVVVENIELKVGRFELFGCDWLITDDYSTYLLEINRCPSLYYYTPVSEYVVGKIFEDLIRVVVDFKEDKKASTE
ncbi:tubulin glycylase 3B-like isoform X2 [Culicoides brevitarsis]|uniref:tubulin glycylase 3B-like isoform X2 n=1 Tax=Culicoides brevitarsis TaxID=469753 RepID=UPI00307BE987